MELTSHNNSSPELVFENETSIEVMQYSSQLKNGLYQEYVGSYFIALIFQPVLFSSATTIYNVNDIELITNFCKYNFVDRLKKCGLLNCHNPHDVIATLKYVFYNFDVELKNYFGLQVENVGCSCSGILFDHVGKQIYVLEGDSNISVVQNKKICFITSTKVPRLPIQKLNLSPSQHEPNLSLIVHEEETNSEVKFEFEEVKSVDAKSEVKSKKYTSLSIEDITFSTTCFGLFRWKQQQSRHPEVKITGFSLQSTDPTFITILSQNLHFTRDIVQRAFKTTTSNRLEEIIGHMLNNFCVSVSSCTPQMDVLLLRIEPIKNLLSLFSFFPLGGFFFVALKIMKFFFHYFFSIIKVFFFSSVFFFYLSLSNPFTP